MNGTAAGFALAGLLLAALLSTLALRGKLGKGGVKVAILVGTPAPALDASDVPRPLYDKMMGYDMGRRGIVSVDRTEADRFWATLEGAGTRGDARGWVAQVDGKAFAFRQGPIP